MCICRHNESYIGQIDLEDIRVICNRAVASPGVWSTNLDSGVFTNAGAVDLPHQKQLHGDCRILNNQRVTAVKPCSDTTAAAADACDAGSSDVIVENGRIVLQYRNNVCSSSANTPTKVHQADTADRTGTGHVVSLAGKSQADLDYDMNDVVWKNLAASNT